MKKYMLYSISALVMGAGVASADLALDPIDLSTGITDAGTLIAVGFDDTDYNVMGPAGSGFAIATGDGYTPYWVAPVSSTNHFGQWITPRGTTTGIDIEGEYVFSIDFSLTAGEISSGAKIMGEWSSDNQGEIFINDVAVPGTVTLQDAWSAYHDFSVLSGFVEGVNTLTFKVQQLGGPGPNPAGLFVNAEVIPEPSSIALLVAMSGGLFVWRRNFRR